MLASLVLEGSRETPAAMADTEDLIAVPIHSAQAAALAALHRQCMGADDGWTNAGMQRLTDAEAAQVLCFWGPPDLDGGHAGKEPLAFVLAFVAAGEAEILALCVAPERQRQGLARKLLRQLAEDLAEQGTDRVYLEVRASNFAARELYRQAGFVETGRRKGYYQGTEDAVVMGKDISNV